MGLSRHKFLIWLAAATGVGALAPAEATLARSSGTIVKTATATRSGEYLYPPLPGSPRRQQGRGQAYEEQPGDEGRRRALRPSGAGVRVTRVPRRLRRGEQQFGADRTRILQVSGLEFSYNSTNPAGQRITSVTLPDGTPLDRSATYTVAANSFIATGGDGFTVFKEGQKPVTLGSDPDALEAYIGGLPSPFEAPDPNSDPRITKQG